MSQSNLSSLKRKRPEKTPSSQVEAESTILNLIKSKKDLGIWARDIKQQTMIPDNIYNKAIKSLLLNALIKEVPNVQNKTKKHYMATEYEPSKELTGGDWYVDGHLDDVFIDALKMACSRYLGAQRVATVEGVHRSVVNSKVINMDISTEQIGEILGSMVLDNDIIEVKSTGLGDYYSIPPGTTCYRVSGVARAPKMGAFASIPCGACPRISLCTSDGVISPRTCVYYTKWLGVDF